MFHNDMDGYCSGYIVYRYFQELKNNGQFDEDIYLFPINYNWKIKYERFNKGDKVFFVDFIPNDDKDIEQLVNDYDLTIIDHHKDAIDNLEKKFPGIKGLRRDDKAGCQLTWEYFFPKETPPKIVDIVGYYDIWEHDKIPNIRAGSLALHELDLIPMKKVGRDIWDRLFSDDQYLSNIIERGIVMLDKQLEEHRRKASFLCQDIILDGRSAVIANIQGVDSYFFDSILDKFKPEILIMYYKYYNSRNNVSHWKVSLRVAPEHRDKVDVSEIARKYGGNGHPGASAFIANKVTDLPFIEYL
jgi:oligoribonuclease NrnB/cAMP/cGMP phosphodiesterase (DHH superfamily)